jgi:hypothetical protein
MSEIQTKKVSSPSGYGLTLDPANGAVTVDGSVSATSFTGDGSALTGLPDPSLPNMVPTTLWSGSSSNANLTTSQSMLNFDFIGLFGGGEHQGHTLYPAAAYVANTYKIHTNGHLFCSYSSTHFWHKPVSATVLNVNGGNTTCRHIVGYKIV